jgi:hypothetical protein
MKTTALISEHAVYVAANNPENIQSIFHIGGSIVFGNSGRTILQLFDSFDGKNADSKKIAAYARKLIKEGEIFVCGRDDDKFSAYRVNNSGASKANDLIASDARCRTVPYSMLVDYLLSSLNYSVEEKTQFGFVCSESAKVLYGKNTSLNLIPSEYCTGGEFDASKNISNTQVHQNLRHHLNAVSAVSALNHYKKPLAAEERRVKHETYSIINEYLVPKSTIESIFSEPAGCSRTELSDLAAKCRNLSVPKKELILPAKYKAASQKKESLIVSLRTSRIMSAHAMQEYKQEHVAKLRMYGDTKHLKYSNSIILSAEQKDLEKISQELSKTYSTIEEVRRPHLAKLPKPIISPINVRAVETMNMWNIGMIGSYDAWLKTKGEGIKVGIIDTGIDYNHKNLKERFDKTNMGYDFVNQNKKPMDENGHGTHVAGITAGFETGVAPKSTLYALRVLDRNGSGSEIDVLMALEWAIDNGMDVVNMSLGFTVNSKPLEEACTAAVSRGVLVCAAAGNDPLEPCFPGDYDVQGVISVAAVDRSHKRAPWSRVNDNNDLCAPGVDIVSSVPGNKYAVMSGTSMATPHVAGAAALVLSYMRQDPGAVEHLMESTAEKIGNKKYYGEGLVRPDLTIVAERKIKVAAGAARRWNM